MNLLDGEKSLGIYDVLHGVGAFLNIIQTFPMLAGRNHQDDHQKYGTTGSGGFGSGWVPISPNMIHPSRPDNPVRNPFLHSTEVETSLEIGGSTRPTTTTTSFSFPEDFATEAVDYLDDPGTTVMMTTTSQVECPFSKYFSNFSKNSRNARL
jgi:hypothetical protein